MNTSMSRWGGYGQAGDVDADLLADAPQESAWSTALSIGSAIPGIVAMFGNPVQRAETLKIKIAEARSRGASLSTIQKLQAKLTAAEQEVAAQEEGAQHRRDLYGLAKVGGATVIGIGAALILFLLVRAFK